MLYWTRPTEHEPPFAQSRPGARATICSCAKSSLLRGVALRQSEHAEVGT